MPRKPAIRHTDTATTDAVSISDGDNIPIRTNTESSFTGNSKRIEKRLSALDKHNVTDERLAKVLDEGLNAGRVVEEIVNGMVVEKVEPDHAVRQKYLDMGMRAREWGIPEKVSVNVDARRVVSLTAEDRVALEGIVRKMKELNTVLDMGGCQSGDVDTVQDGEIVNTMIGVKGGDYCEEKG